MGELYRATERLQAALDRLERTVGRDGPAEGAGDLRAALSAAQRETSQLQEIARNVADRLDGTIDRLKGSPRN